MSDASDDFGPLESFSEFTTEDYAAIDAAVAASLVLPVGPSIPHGDPSITVELEEPPAKDPPSLIEPSPLNRFRRHKLLSVTDLVSLVWCEVQFDYGLRQRRYLRLESRPGSFTSREGKEIVVEKAVSAQNEKILNQGRIVHKKLEQDIRPIEVRVDITTPEEQWALRLVRMIGSLETLLGQISCAREIPVFGILHDQVVVGIIDELVRIPSTFRGTKRPSTSPPSTPQKSKKCNRDTSNDAEHKNAPDEPAPPQDVKSAPQYILKLVDTKTRRTASLPSDDDALSSRFQLMIYHRLLSALLDTERPFDFPGLWHRLGLDPWSSFSKTFILQASSILEQDLQSTCLYELCSLWMDTASRLDVPGIDPTLQLVYRLQPPASEPLVDHDLLAAITASLNDNQVSGMPEGLELLLGLQQSLMSPSVSVPPEVLGTKEFLFDGQLLDRHLVDVFQWWNGERRSRGVPIQHTRRCSSCEYRSGCEWREEKALEMAKGNRT
ncbi:exonuclease V [Mycena floridula]|nr:exonuclease V [Mycena floridula]